VTENAAYTPRQANTALALLLLAYILSFIDRNVMSVLIGPIRQDFNISDFEYSLLHGFAFSMFYISLGLPIAREIARAHGGRIEVTSTPGQGTTFSVWLPRADGGEGGGR